jgi:hypothetical protein
VKPGTEEAFNRVQGEASGYGMQIYIFFFRVSTAIVGEVLLIDEI